MRYTKILVLIGMVMNPVLAKEKTVLVNYKDGSGGGFHNSNKQGGGFNTENAKAWVYDLGASMAEWADNKPSNVGSPGNLIIGRAFTKNGGGAKIPAVRMDHTVAQGDTFNISFMWYGPKHWGETSKITLFLYYTDTDKVDGIAKDIVSLSSEVSKETQTWYTESDKGLRFDDDAAVGKKLFARVDTHVKPGVFARLDNVFIAVKSDGGASSHSALLGLGGVTVTLQNRDE